jgi:hypothetical protein
MFNKLLFAVMLGLASLFINSQTAYSQSSTDEEKKFEVGAQFSVLHSAIPQARFNGIVCVTTPGVCDIKVSRMATRLWWQIWLQSKH